MNVKAGARLESTAGCQDSLLEQTEGELQKRAALGVALFTSLLYTIYGCST